MNTQISITQNGTTTLATAGKYCDRNIDVNVEVEDSGADVFAAMAQGTISGSYASDEVTSVRGYAFVSCANLSGVSLPNCTTIGVASFRDCSALETVNLPSCVTFSGGSFFDGATNLKTINVPNLTTIENGARTFANIKGLEEFNAPNLTSITTGTGNMFNSCTKLKKVKFPKLGGATLGSSMFSWCSQLKILVLGGNQLNPLGNVNAFSNAGIYSGGFTVYVPDDLVDTYKTATNWSNFASQIKPISELEE